MRIEPTVKTYQPYIQKTDNKPMQLDSSEKDSHFDSLAPNAPKSVKDAWEKATEDNGIVRNPKLSHLSAMRVLQCEQVYNTGNYDLLGNSIQTAKAATERAIERLKNPLDKQPLSEYEKQDLKFYQDFYNNLCKL